MDKRHVNIFGTRLVIGLLIVAAGVLLLLEKMNVIKDVNILDYWPVILIVMGVGKLFQQGLDRYHKVFWGIILTAVGVLFLLNNLHYIHFWFDDLWPILIIIVGFEIIRGGLFKHRVHARWMEMDEKTKEKFASGCCSQFSGSQNLDVDFINISAILGGGEYLFTNKKLKGGVISVILGGCDIDLRDADMEEDSMVLETSSILGGIDIRVPRHWQVEVQGTPILGEMANKTVSTENPVKKLFVRGSAIMGGVEIKN
jgi:predicted membrane protein